MKILITGNAGSGKSTLAAELSKKLDLPLYGLDRVVWRENWKKTSQEEREREIKKIVSNEKWIIEGVSKSVLACADKVIFLDISTSKCILNIFRRFLKNGIKTRKELPLNCPEYIGVLKALKIALIFNRITRPWILDLTSKEKLIEVKKYEDLVASDLFNTLKL